MAAISSVAVLVLAARLHQLQVVEDHQIERALGLEPPRLGGDLEQGRVGRVVDVERRLADLLGGLDHPVPLLLRQVAGAQGGAGDVGLGRQDPQRQLLLAHLEREDADRQPLVEGGILGHVERQRGLAHAGAAGDDDQVGGAQAARLVVQVVEAGGHADQAVGGPLLEVGHGLLDDPPETHEAALDRLLAQAQDRLLGPAQRLLRDQPAVETVAGDGAAGLDQPPADRALLDDLDVGVEPPQIGQVDVERRRDRRAPPTPSRCLRLSSCACSVRRSTSVPGCLQVEHRLVDHAVALGVEILRRQPRRDRRDQARIEQHAGEHRTLGLLAVRDVLGRLQRFDHDAAGRGSPLWPKPPAAIKADGTHGSPRRRRPPGLLRQDAGPNPDLPRPSMTKARCKQVARRGVNHHHVDGARGPDIRQQRRRPAASACRAGSACPARSWRRRRRRARAASGPPARRVHSSTSSAIGCHRNRAAPRGRWARTARGRPCSLKVSPLLPSTTSSRGVPVSVSMLAVASSPAPTTPAKSPSAPRNW